MIVFKGFNKDLACTKGKGKFQYAIGAKAKAEEAQTAHSGLHSTKEPFGVLRYYSNFGEDRYCICEAAGDINEDGDHRVSSTELTPLKEIDVRELAVYEAAWLEKHPTLPYSRDVIEEQGTDNGFFAVVRGKNPKAHAKTKGALIILLQEYKTKSEIKAVAVYEIDEVGQKGWYDMEGRLKGEKSSIKEVENPKSKPGNHKKSQ